MKKALSLIITALLTASIMSGCGKNMSESITVLSREDGSGTRGAFIELLGIEEKNSEGKKIDRTIDTSEITNSTSVMMTTVAGNRGSIGYISLGSLNDTVKALKIDGMEATAENVKSGSYKVCRPFNIAINDDVNGAASDFINYILSEDGQKIVEDNGYISNENSGKFNGGNTEGKIAIAGSSSVTPVMEKLKEAYLKINKKVTIEIQQSDSTTGMTSTIDGVCDIGMASRELKDSEKEAGLNAIPIALDGIAIVVNKDNNLDNITTDQVMKVYIGNITTWSELK